MRSILYLKIARYLTWLARHELGLDLGPERDRCLLLITACQDCLAYR